MEYTYKIVKAPAGFPQENSLDKNYLYIITCLSCDDIDPDLAERLQNFDEVLVF